MKVFPKFLASFDKLQSVTLCIEQEHEDNDEEEKVSTLKRLEASLGMNPSFEEEFYEMGKRWYTAVDRRRIWRWKASVYQPMNWTKVCEENDWTDEGFRAHVESQIDRW